jgi:hypothetical protein
MAHFATGKGLRKRRDGLCLHFLERRLVDSYTTVVIPFDERVIFIDLPNCAKFSSRHSEVAQPSTRSPGLNSRPVPEGSTSGGFLARSESGEPPGVTTAVGELYAVWVSAYC